LLGLIAGYKGGWTSIVIMRVAEAQAAFPGLLLVVVLVGAVGPSVKVLIIVMAIYGWMVYARIVRSLVLQLREAPYVVAAELSGAGTGRVIRRHLLPPVVAPVVIQAVLDLGRVMLGEATLSYLGLGVQPPRISLGLMVAENQQYLEQAWWSVVVPGAALAICVLSINLFARSFTTGMDPRNVSVTQRVVNKVRQQ
jgi:peptide/nickel transport system permease protein